MPDDDLDNDSTDDGDDGSGPGTYLSRKDIRALESKGKKFDTLASDNEQLKRDLAFARAGIDTSTDDGAFFARGYQGDLTTEAIKAAAGRFNLLAPGSVATGQTSATTENGNPTTPSEAPNPTLEPGEADLTAARNSLAQGAVQELAGDVDPYKEAIALGEKVLADGGKFEEAMGHAINLVVNRANQGDSRVIIKRDSPQAIGAPLGS